MKIAKMITVIAIKVASPPSMPEMRGVRNVVFWEGLADGGGAGDEVAASAFEVVAMTGLLRLGEGLGTDDESLMLAVSEGSGIVLVSILELGCIQLTYTGVM